MAGDDDGCQQDATVLLHLGPDSAFRIVLWLGPVALTTLLGSVGVIQTRGTVGFLVVAWLLGVWYCWRAGTKLSITVTRDQLEIVTPLRSFQTPWTSVVHTGWRFGHMVVRTSDGGQFRIPQYSITAAIRAVPFMVASRRRLETAFREAMAARSDASDANNGPRTEWIHPSVGFLAVTAVLAVAAEVASFVIR